MGRIILEKIEECKGIEQIMYLSANNDIPIKYAILIRNIKNDFNGSVTIRKVMEYIRSNYQKRITVQSLAERFGVSSEYLSSLFHRQVGVTIPEYINSYKIRQAEVLLKYTDMPLIDISTLLSFSSQSYFQTVFKKRTGTTPARYRHNQ